MKVIRILVIWALVVMSQAKAYSQEIFNNADLQTKQDGILSESIIGESILSENIRTLRFGITDPGWMPFIGTDVQNRLTGISGDLVNDFSRGYGIDIEVVKYQDLSRLMKALSQGEIDFSSDIVSTKVRRESVAFTKRYAQSHIGIITHNTNTRYLSLTALKGKTVAIEKGFYLVDALSRNHPDIELMAVNSTEDALRRVSARHVDAYIGNLEVANFLINHELIPNLTATTNLHDQTKPLSFAVKPGYGALVSLLDNYLVKVINNEVITDLRLKWELGNFQPVESYQKLLNRTVLALFFIVIAFTVLIFWIRNMKAMIAERNKLLEELKSNKRNLVQILDSIDLGIVKIDTNHKVTYINKNAYQYFSVGTEDIGNIEILDLVEGQMANFNLPRTIRIKAYEIVKDNLYAEYRVRNETCVVDVCHLPLKDGEALVTYTDVTQRVREEEARHIETEKLAASGNINENIIANISHKMRSPLNDILETLDTLDRSELMLEQKRHVGELGCSANLLSDIINDISLVSTLGAGEIKLTIKEGSIVHSVEKVCATLAPLAAQKGLGFYLDIDPDIAPGLYFDALHLELILYNLIDNAIKFTASGSISLNVELDGEYESSQHVFFSVKDTGVGIETSKLALLFSPTTNTETNPKQRTVRAGLGLSICGNIAEAMDADLSLDSQQSMGTETKLTVAMNRSLTMFEDPLDLKGIEFNLCCMDQHINKTIHNYLVSWGATVNIFDLADLLPKLSQFENDAICILNHSVWSINLVKTTLSERNYSLINLITEPDISYFQTHDNYIELPTNPLFKSLLKKTVRHLLDSFNIDGSDGDVGDIKIIEPIEKPITDGELILLVEDNDHYRDVILKQLHLLGFKVDIAENGVRGLHAWGKGLYRLILTACDMRQMNGYDMTNNIRMLESEGDRIPIIALTSMGIEGEGEREKSLSAGADDYIAKPANMKQLSSRLSHWMLTYGKNIVKIDHEIDTNITYEKLNLGPDRQALLEVFSEVELKGVMEVFSETLEKESCVLNEANLFLNRHDLKIYAQRIKSICRSIYANQIANVAEKIELSADSGEWDELQVTIRKFNALVERFKFVIREEFV